MVVNIAYIPKVYIPHYYHGVISNFKNSKIKAKIIKTEGLVKNKISYMRFDFSLDLLF